MPKKDPSQEALDEVRAMEHGESSDASIARLRKLLGHRSNHVVGRAAQLAGKWKAEDAIPELLAAFERFVASPVKLDPGCIAKQPIIEALCALNHNDPEIFLLAARHVQREPGFTDGDPDQWKPPIARRQWKEPEALKSKEDDTAATLRGTAGDGLLGCGYTDTHFVLASLLFDAESRTRRIAMESLVGAAAYSSELLIRAALLAGEPEGDIFSMGIQGLMAINAERSLPFVREFLSNPDVSVAEEAALAIGEARLPESFPTLRAAWDLPTWSESRTLLLLPMALTRDDAALDFLMELIQEGQKYLAESAITVLGIYNGQPERVTVIQAAVDSRRSRELAQVFERVFAG
jgi:hypothetical protein